MIAVTMSRALTLVGAMMCAIPLVSHAADLTPQERAAIEAQRFKASSTIEYIIVAGRYERAGLKQTAKEVVDQASRSCKTASDWAMVADAYHRLGYTENASVADRRARELRQ